MNKKNIITFLLVVVFFAIPIIGAWWVFSHHSHLPLKTLNHGTLINPPIAIQPLNLTADKAFDPKVWQQHWVLLYINPSDTCAHACQQNLYYLRQIRAALGKNQDQVVRVYVSFAIATPTQDLLNKAFAGTKGFTITPTELARFLKGQDFSAATLKDGQLLIVDPNGWVMMRYPVDFKAKDVLDDMNRLLSVN